MGERRAEERHDAVAHHLIDRALVVMDGIHHQREDGIENLARLLGIAVGQQFHGPLQVSEEHGDLLALPFEGRLRGEDLLGEVPGSVGLGRGEARLSGLVERRRTLAAELVPRRIARATGWAGRRQWRSALAAELHPGGILYLASRTPHPRPPYTGR
jgi:hypothetical protein